MKTAGKTRTAPLGRVISIAIVALAAALAVYALGKLRPILHRVSTSIDADVVHVAAAVGGRIIELPVVENMREGSLLFQIDPLPYRLAVEQSAAELGIARSKAAIAADKTNSAQENHDWRHARSKGFDP